jgi:integrase
MASITRRRGSEIWTAFFRDETGRQHCRSTETTDRQLARRIAEEFEAAAQKKRTLRQLQRVLDQMHELISGEAVQRLTFRDFAHQWLEVKKPAVAPSTLDFYSDGAAKFRAFLGQKADLPLSQITKADLINYRNSLVFALAPKTVNHHLKFVKTLFRAAKRDGLLVDDPGESVETIKRANPGTNKRRAFSLQELSAVLSVADPEWRSMILFGLYTGQRLGDIASLTWDNIDLATNQIRLRAAKTGRLMILPLAPALCKHVLSLAGNDNPSAPLHPRAYRIRETQSRTGTLSNQFSDLLALAGLRQKKSHHKALGGRSVARQNGDLSFHCLRHTTTSLLHAAGIPPAIAQAFVGHDSESIHALYTHVGSENLQKAANALPGLL